MLEVECDMAYFVEQDDVGRADDVFIKCPSHREEGSRKGVDYIASELGRGPFCYLLGAYSPEPGAACVPADDGILARPRDVNEAHGVSTYSGHDAVDLMQATVGLIVSPAAEPRLSLVTMSHGDSRGSRRDRQPPHIGAGS